MTPRASHRSVVEPALTYLALGGGTQSGCMALMAAEDELPRRPDVMIFADTGDEPSYVVEQVETCRRLGEAAGIPLEIVKEEKRFPLSDHIASALDGRASISNSPAYTQAADGSPSGVLMRKCSRDVKIRPIERKAMEIARGKLGLPPRGSLPDRCVVGLVGISIDEASRMKPSRDPWLELAFPLIAMGMSRKDCVERVEAAGLPAFKRSACWHCPYHGDGYWIWLRSHHQREWSLAVDYDRRVIRNLRGKAGIEDTPFLHPARVPLDEVRLGMWRDDPGQGTLFDAFDNDCEPQGGCGI